MDETGMSRQTRQRRPLTLGLALAIAMAAVIALSGAAAVAQDATSGPDILSETYRDWIVRCQTAPAQGDQSGTRLCEMVQDLRQQEGGERVLSIALRPEENAGDGFLTMITPFGLKVIEQVQIDIDDATIAQAPFQTCLPQGCIVQASLGETAIASMRGGETAVIRLPTATGEAFEVSISLLGFTAAWTRLSQL